MVFNYSLALGHTLPLLVFGNSKVQSFKLSSLLIVQRSSAFHLRGFVNIVCLSLKQWKTPESV